MHSFFSVLLILTGIFATKFLPVEAGKLYFGQPQCYIHQYECIQNCPNSGLQWCEQRGLKTRPICVGEKVGNKFYGDGFYEKFTVNRTFWVCNDEALEVVITVCIVAACLVTLATIALCFYCYYDKIPVPDEDTNPMLTSASQPTISDRISNFTWYQDESKPQLVKMFADLSLMEHQISKMPMEKLQ